MIRLHSLILATSLLVSSLIASAQTPAARPPLNVNWLEMRGLDQPIAPDQPVLDIAWRSGGRTGKTVLPAVADTSISQGKTEPLGTGKSLILRDGRFYQTLMKFDLSGIPKDAEITEASFRFKVGGVEKKGLSGEFKFFRILTPWAENATWLSSGGASPREWRGLRASEDFDAAPIATLHEEALDDKKTGGQFLTVPDFAPVVRDWVKGAKPNHGILVQFSGRAMQLSLASREAADDRNSFLIGGDTAAKILLVPNTALLERLLLSPSELLGAHATLHRIRARSTTPGGKTGAVKFYAATLTDDGKIAPGSPRELGSVPLASIPDIGAFELPDFVNIARQWAGPNSANQVLVVTFSGDPGAVIELAGPRQGDRRPLMRLTLAATPNHRLFTAPLLPKPGVFTTIKDGHLNYDGERLRLWGVVGYPDVPRLTKMGFNAQRVWQPSSQDFGKVGTSYTAESIRTGEFAPYVQGDNSDMDRADRHFAELKKHGFFVMFAALSGTMPINALLSDDSFIAGGSDWEQWKEAIKQKGGEPAHWTLVDERLQRAKIQHAKNLLNHVNPYTGQRYAEEETIAIYEIFNENGFVYKGLTGAIDKWPAYFRKKLDARWNAWLKKRYATDAALAKAWGKVRDGESLSNGSIGFAPVLAQRTEYPEQRGNDIVEFMIDLCDSFHQEFRTQARAVGTPGRGVAVVPFSFDTLYRPSIQWAYVQSKGDVYSLGMYFFDLRTMLDKPPSAYVIDSLTVKGMPNVIYETNNGRPGPTRAEYPFKLAALTSHQDWDGVIWHYWAPGGREDDLAYLTGIIQPPRPTHYWTAVHNEYDQVMCSSIAMAGRLFLNGMVPPAADPATVLIGGQALNSYASFRGIGARQLTFTRGAALAFDPNAKSGVTVDGQPMPDSDRLTQAIKSGDYVTWDWPNARLIIDAPNIKAYIGKPDKAFRFSDGITLGDVTTPFIAFSLVSADGSPLTGPNAAKRVYVTGVADAQNTDFDFDWSVKGGPAEQAKAVRNVGREPVVVQPVGYTLWFPTEIDAVRKDYDFALRETGSVRAAGNKLVQSGDTPFVSVIEIALRGAPAATPLKEATRIAVEVPASATGRTGATGAAAVVTDPANAALFFPGYDWTLDYADSHKNLRDAPVLLSSVSRFEPAPAPEKRIELSDTQLATLWDATADLVFTFREEKLHQLEITFKAPPPLNDVIARYSKIFGEPVQKKIDLQYGTSEVRWKGAPGRPEVFVTESQGTMKILVTPPAR